jgi:stage II sporulation protein B
MDKQSSTKIRIKINGDERPFKEEVAIHNWSKSEEELAAATEEAVDDDQFDWVLPDVDENQVNEFKRIYYEPAIDSPKSGKKSGKKSSSHILTIIVSAATAISIGILFGFIMLKIIAYQGEGVSQKTLGNQPNSVPIGASNQKTQSISLPSFSTSLVQGGVYDNAEAAANQIKTKGVPNAIINMGGKQYIFIGVSDNLETTKLLANEFKSKVEGVFGKTLTFDSKSMKISTSDEKVFLGQTASLYQKMASVVSNGYLTGTLNAEGLSAIGKQMKQIQEIKDIKDKKIKNLFSLQTECSQHLENFQKENNKKELLNAEQALLTYLKQYSEL